MDAPCNGWEHWFYMDEGEMKPLDALREMYLTNQ